MPNIIAAGEYPDLFERVDPFALPIAKIAAGTDLSFQIPVGLNWNVVSVIATFTASAGVANRVINFQVKDQNGTLVYAYPLPQLTASQSQTFLFSEDVVSVPSSLTTGGTVLVPLPSTWFSSEWTFGTSTTNIQAGDQWSAVGCWVQAYLPSAGE